MSGIQVRSRGTAAAFTLLEVLLSTAIAAVVAALAWSLYFSVHRTLRGQQDRLAGHDRVHTAFVQLKRDLMNAAPVNQGTNQWFQLTNVKGVSGLSRLQFARLQRLTGESDPRWSELVATRYEVNPDQGLERRTWRLAGPTNETVELLLPGEVTFHIEALYQKQSFLEWPSGGVKGMPNGIQVELRVASEPEPVKGRILIPVGLRVKPSDALDKPGILAPLRMQGS